MQRFLRPLVPLVLAPLILTACASSRPAAATVDGQSITDTQLSQDMVFFRFLSDLSQQSCGGPPVQGESAEASCARFTLGNLIQEDLVKGYAQSHHLSVPEATVTNALTQLESTVGGAKQLDSQLKAAGMTRADLTALARRLLLFDQVQKSVAAQRVSQQQLRQVYLQQITSFTQLDVRHILVKTEAQAQRIERQVNAKNFGDLAKKYSTDTQSAANGGDLGTIAWSTFTQSYDADFVRATLKLKPGQISPPVRTQFGWHIIQLVSRKVQPFNAVEDQLRQSLGSQAFASWLQQRLADADISVNPKYGRLDRNSGEVVPVRTTATGSEAPTSPAPAASATP
ncbi:MAG TPA: peptidylprolyl isomerase [Actinomycetota bacterium]|jgi:hypothetical protein|nr:peptidylprolyl isomerase [Actinomycetota bacterium]